MTAPTPPPKDSLHGYDLAFSYPSLDCFGPKPDRSADLDEWHAPLPDHPVDVAVGYAEHRGQVARGEQVRKQEPS